MNDWKAKIKVISEGGEEMDITEELNQREEEQLDIIVQAVYKRFWNRKGEDVFESTPEYRVGRPGVYGERRPTREEIEEDKE